MAQQKSTPAASPIRQVFLSIGIGVAAFILLAGLIQGGISLVSLGRILPGVTLNGVSLAGMSVEEAAATISNNFQYPDSGTLILTDGDNSWPVKPVQLGYYLDPQASARAAYETGRKGRLLEILIQRAGLLGRPVSVQPTFVFDQKIAVQYLTSLAAQIDRPVREAHISISGTQVEVINGQSGRVLDLPASLEALTRQIQSMQDGVIPLVVIESEPLILNAEVPGELARSVLSQPLSLTLPPDAVGQVTSLQIQPDDLAPLLAFSKVGDGQNAQYQITVNNALMTAWLTSIKKDLDLAPINARFIFNDDTGQLDIKDHAVIGRSLDISATISAINLALQQGSHDASLNFVFTNPPVTDQTTGAELGITELLQEYTSFFAGSNSDRIQNIKAASSKFHGLLVAPGETVSMAEVLGDISLDNGYAEALIILGDQTIKGVGGGVCQVSTTLFRTVFFAGLQIDERHPHAYRVKYYEQVNSVGRHDASLAGMDATVFVPIVDFKFTNDSPYWMLMETYVSPTYNSLTWKFYSTKDGRTVSDTRSGPTNVVKPPDAVYRENPDLPTGTKKQVDWAAEGADVVVTRTVTRNGEVIHNDRIVTHYAPWAEVWEYGPGTEIPTPTPSP